MKKTKTTKRAFTLVELLAVIVILAIVLVIAVPQIMDTIEKSKKGSMESSAKLVASEVELKYNTALTTGDTFNTSGSCMSYGNLDDDEYASCTYSITNGKASVTLTGKSGGKFDSYTCTGATKIEATCTKGTISSIPDPVAFATDSWETIQKAVQDNNTSAYSVGDTKSIDLGDLGEHTVRIANMSSDWEHCGSTGASEGYSQTACGFVVEFVDVITTHVMNSTDSNVGGWASSEMRAYLNGEIDSETKNINYSSTIGVNGEGTIYNAIKTVTGDIIVDTTVVSGHGDNAGETNFTTTDKVYLLSEHEVWADETEYDTAYNNTRQLDYYSDPNGDGDYTDAVTTSNFSEAIKQYSSSNNYWWLRAAKSNDSYYFLSTDDYGCWSFGDANFIDGVSPAFRIG